MSYSDNPRKVYGKVEIIYSDSDTEQVEGVDVIDNSLISHPDEVYKSYMVPSVKSCTMDGNSILDGTYQMMDDRSVIGWWGKELSKEDNTFITPQTLTLKFKKRAIVSWLIIGDSLLNQYPVDFVVEFVSGETVISKEIVTKNTLVQYKIYKTLENITSIKITISKWSNSNACVKLLRFYDSLAETYDESCIKSFEVMEEMCSEDASYNINSDSMNILLYNKDGKFTKGYLKNLLVLDRKVRPFIGIEKNGIIEYTSLGTFYSEEWKVEDDGRWLKCTAVDKLLRLQNKTYLGFTIDFGVSLYYIAEDILKKAGITKYEISPLLLEIKVGDVFMEKMTVWDALQEIANTGLCFIYIDRNDKLMIVSDFDEKELSNIELSKDNMFSYTSNISLTEFANRIIVEYAEVVISEDITEALNTSITINANEEIELMIDYASEVAAAAPVVNNANIDIISFDSGTNACNIKLKNKTDTIETANLIITGPAIDITYKSIYVQDDESVRDFGVFEYSHPTCKFLQSKNDALRIANHLLKKLKAGEGTVTSIWRGNPELELGKIYNCDKGPGEENTLICESNKISYDGSLREETRGRKKS